MSRLRRLLARILRRKDEDQNAAPPQPTLRVLPTRQGPRTAPEWWEEARRLAGLGQWERAIPCLEQAIALDPQSASAWCDKARCLGALGRLEEAVACYDQALAIDPRMAAAWFSKALAEEKLDRTDDAIHSYKRYIAAAPPVDAQQVEYARHCLRHLGAKDEVHSTAPSSPPPGRPSPSAPAGSKFRQEGETEAGEAPVPTPVPRAQDVAAWVREGQKFVDLGRPSQALACYDRALALDAHNLEAWQGKATCLIALNRLDEALTGIDRALVLNPDSIEGWRIKIAVLTALNRPEEVVACWDRVLALDPSDATVWINKGNSLAALGRLHEAIDSYAQAVALDAGDADAWFVKATAEERIGRTPDAVRSYRRCLAAASSSNLAQVEHVRRRLRALGAGVEGNAEPQTPQAPDPPAPQPRRTRHAGAAGGAQYRKGDRIGEFEVQDMLGQGGFGVVYLVHLPIPGDIASLRTFREEELVGRGRESDQYVTYALKTLHEHYLAVPAVRKRFRHEAQLLVNLERHPHLLQADFVDEIAGRLYIATEYVAPNAQGLNSLEGYLQRCPPDLAQSLRWAIQVCHGMEYAYSKGLRCHRDLKPANILVTHDRTAKVADFGLAGALDQARLTDGIEVHIDGGQVGLSAATDEGVGFGTPTHMPPEQFTRAAACDERSDIYAFGIVLYQMVARGQLPFVAAPPRDGSLAERRRFWSEMYQLHRTASVPPLNSPLFPIIERCLAKEPEQRYQTFAHVRRVLEPLLHEETGQVVEVPAAREPTAGEWHIKGYSLAAMVRWQQAIECYDRSLDLEPRNATTWSNKGNCLSELGRHAEALTCHDRALALNPLFAEAWNNRGTTLAALERWAEAAECFDRASSLNPQFAQAWANKATSLLNLGSLSKAISCIDHALHLAPRDEAMWNNKGLILARLGCRQEALTCFDRALALNPRLAEAWSSKAENLAYLGKRRDALDCCEQALALDPRHIVAWNNKGANLSALGRCEEAIVCYERVLALDPEEAMAWNNKANNLAALGRTGEAMACYEKAVALDPEYAHAWFNKAITEDRAGRRRDAARSYERFLAVATPEDVVHIAHARQRLHDLPR